MVRQVRFFQANIGNTFPMMYGIELNRGTANKIISEIFISPSARAHIESIQQSSGYQRDHKVINIQ